MTDEDILENLLLALSDEQEHFAIFNKKTCRYKFCWFCWCNSQVKFTQLSLMFESNYCWNTVINSLSSWKDGFDKSDTCKELKTRLTQNHDTLPRRCRNFHQNNVKRCFHCYHRGSLEHSLVNCLKQKRDKKLQRKN